MLSGICLAQLPLPPQQIMEHWLWGFAVGQQIGGQEGPGSGIAGGHKGVCGVTGPWVWGITVGQPHGRVLCPHRCAVGHCACGLTIFPCRGERWELWISF